MKVILYEPGKPPRIAEIENTLEAMQKTVGGYIQAVPLTPLLTLICDEEGKLKNKPVNRLLFFDGRHGTDVLVGTCFVCRTAGEDFAGVLETDRDMANLFIRDWRCVENEMD